MRAVIGVAAAWTASPLATYAAPPAQPAMNFEVVHGVDASCAPNCPEWIAAQGQIMRGTAQTFRAFLAKLDGRRRPVLISSNGGSIEDAIDMGRLIRARGLAVAVAHTVPAYNEGNTSADAAGRLAFAFPALCASACTVVLAAGVERYANTRAVIGVHQTIEHLSQTFVYRRYLVHYRIVNGRKQQVSREQISEDRNTVASTRVSDPAVNDRLTAYFREMGETPAILTLMQEATPQQIHVMTSAELEDTHLLTIWINQPMAMDVAPEENGLAGIPIDANSGSHVVLLAGQSWPISSVTPGRQPRFGLDLATRRGGGVVTATVTFSDMPDGAVVAIPPSGPFRVGASQNYPISDFCRLARTGFVEAREPEGPTQSAGLPDPRASLLRVPLAAIDGVTKLTEELCGSPVEAVTQAPHRRL